MWLMTGKCSCGATIPHGSPYPYQCPQCLLTARRAVGGPCDGGVYYWTAESVAANYAPKMFARYDFGADGCYHFHSAMREEDLEVVGRAGESPGV